ncbi:PH domain-containing protein [Brachybacterium nesterenkovii]|uniref:PH domain-containing protein n=1 Tax=Brachybacterium nesterenkovii TaxID=47847 RepID=A0A1X6WWA4_9MICO|nr:PH domain-containing protein [Brachybacterium nesterenkovii]SLM89742.1 hypothetical protein FM110_04140 [Brachybacterium nesterenkovii]
MDWLIFFAVVAVVIGGGAGAVAVLRRVLLPPAPPGSVVLRYPAMLGGLAGTFVLLGLVFLLVAQTYAPDDPRRGDALPMSLFGAGFAVFGVVFGAMMLRHSITLTADGIIQQALLGRRRRIRYADIIGIEWPRPRRLAWDLGSLAESMLAQDRLRIRGSDGTTILVRRTEWARQANQAIAWWAAEHPGETPIAVRWPDPGSARSA